MSESLFSGSGTLKTLAKWALASRPGLFIPLYRILAPASHRRLLISPSTQIVIEGFPRSANTFAVVAFEMTQHTPVRIAHHLHVAAQILEGVRRSLPVLVLIRDPEEAIRSLCARHPRTDPAWALRHYLDFYAAVRRVASRVVLADFAQVTSDYGAVIERLNAKFDTRFDPFEHSPANVRQVFDRIESINLALHDGRETHISRPSAERARSYERTAPLGPAALRERAAAVYRTLVGPDPATVMQ